MIDGVEFSNSSNIQSINDGSLNLFRDNSVNKLGVDLTNKGVDMSNVL
jgi:hypothetical protein